MIKNILLVEDDKLFASRVIDKFKTDTYFSMVWTQTMAETAKVLEKNGANFFSAAILDFRLPDAMDGEIIDLIVSKGIPAIIFTSYVDKTVRDTVWSKMVVDYVLKEDNRSMDYIITLINRLEKNPGTEVLVVDNSLAFRNIIVDLLKTHRYNVLTAKNGNEALKLIDGHPGIKIVITEYNMPKMNGLILTQKIREKHAIDNLAIIGLSSEDKELIGSRFLKYGATDFIPKQAFTTEEFYRRITQNIESLEHIHYIKETSIKDYLTGLFNRRYLFEFGQKLISNVARGNINMVCAILDIDDFKIINDTYGHKAGDIVLQKVSLILKKRMRDSDIVARFGGDEFCILAINMKKEYLSNVFENLCKLFESTDIEIGAGTNVKVTISIGVCTKPKDNIDLLMVEADKQLFKAKNKGRNRAEIDINEIDK